MSGFKEFYSEKQEGIQLQGLTRTVPNLIIQSASSYGDSIAITDGKVDITYSQLPIWARYSAEKLRSKGVQSGDRIMVVANNSLELLEIFLGCAWLGSIFVPVNPLVRAAQFEYFMQSTTPQLLFLDHSTYTRWKESADSIFRSVNCEVLSQSSVPDLDLSIRNGPVDVQKRDPADTLAILFTSGTTGRPKGVMCPDGQFLRWGEVVGEALRLGPDDVAYTCLPLFHTNALNALFQCIVFGATFHLGPRFSVSQFWPRMIESRATVTYLLGAMVTMLTNAEPTQLDTKHTVRIALAPGTPVPVIEEFESRFSIQLVEAHGMTETNAAIGPVQGEQRLGYMGRVINGFDACVVDSKGMAVPDGEPGELLLRTFTPHSFATGYWQLPDETTHAMRNGWFHSGDRVIREDGWYRFVDRIKDVIRRRGENISAWEVEQALQSHEFISNAAVIPVPSELGEDEVMAFIIPALHSFISPEEILDSCSKLLPHFALPRYIEFVSELPLTETGKVRKVELRERGIGSTTWDAQKAGYIAKR
jgi:crotonobetaine/carnitine-CoA ligase